MHAQAGAMHAAGQLDGAPLDELHAPIRSVQLHIVLVKVRDSCPVCSPLRELGDVRIWGKRVRMKVLQRAFVAVEKGCSPMVKACLPEYLQ